MKVFGSYDKGDNTWIEYENAKGEFAVAYHGIRYDIGNIKKILNTYLKEGKNKAYEYDEDSLHSGQKCVRGVYLSSKIAVVEEYTDVLTVREINKSFRVVFQCRVNPEKIRQPKTQPDYWILKGDGQEIRPYRLLVKEEENKSIINNENNENDN